MTWVIQWYNPDTGQWYYGARRRTEEQITALVTELEKRYPSVQFRTKDEDARGA